MLSRSVLDTVNSEAGVVPLAEAAGINAAVSPWGVAPKENVLEGLTSLHGFDELSTVHVGSRLSQKNSVVAVECDIANELFTHSLYVLCQLDYILEGGGY
jgi:hypothetical protein